MLRWLEAKIAQHSGEHTLIAHATVPARAGVLVCPGDFALHLPSQPGCAAARIPDGDHRPTAGFTPATSFPYIGFRCVPPGYVGAPWRGSAELLRVRTDSRYAIAASRACASAIRSMSRPHPARTRANGTSRATPSTRATCMAQERRSPDATRDAAVDRLAMRRPRHVLCGPGFSATCCRAGCPAAAAKRRCRCGPRPSSRGRPRACGGRAEVRQAPGRCTARPASAPRWA